MAPGDARETAGRRRQSRKPDSAEIFHSRISPGNIEAENVMKQAIIILASALAVWVGAVPLRAQTEQEPTGLEVTRQLQKENLKSPEPYRERIEREGNVLRLTLSETIRLALTNNLNIAIENFNEDLTRETTASIEGFYDPLLSFTVGFADNTTPTASSLEAGMDNRFTWNTSYRQEIQTGGNLTVSLFNSRRSDNNFFTTLNPAFSSTFLVDFSQPLWRGFRQTDTQRRIKVSNLNAEINDLQFQQRVSEVIQLVQDQYWELLFAVDNYETQRQGVELAIIQHRNNQKRVSIGVSAPIDITSSRSEVAGREQTMISSEVGIINAQNRLKRFISPNPNDPIWRRIILPTDRPATPGISISIDEAIDTAIQNRPELKQIQVQLEQDAINTKFFRKEKKPSVDLRFRYSSASLSGDQLVDSDGDNIPDLAVPLGNLGNSLFDAFQFDFTSWSIFADVRIPLGNRTSEANLAQVAINERRNLSRLHDAQQGIIVEVRNAYEGLKTQRKQLEAARLATRLAREQLRGENKRFKSGLSTNFQVLRFQRDLTLFTAQELRALINYEQGVTSLNKATFTIIGNSDIVLAKTENRK